MTARKKAAPKAKAQPKRATSKKAAPQKAAATDKAAAAEAVAADKQAAFEVAAPTPASAPVRSAFADVPAVLIAAAEAAPLAKTGGLADVVGALPKYLKEIGVDARIIMPFHRVIKERYGQVAEHLFDYNVGEQWSSRFVGVDKLELDGITYYFIDNEHYYSDKIYSGDNFEGEQYGFFVQAVCDVLPNLDFDPGIVHCNDWHTAMIPFKLRAKAAREQTLAPKTLLTIHNLAFQGTYGDDLDARLVGDAERAYAWDLGCWNTMKAGIDTADRVNTVSPTYAWEITTPEFGEGLQDDLRFLADEGRLSGILNGIDTDAWDPAHDAHLPATFSVADERGKLTCKQELLRELGLDGDVDAPLVAMVGRLTPQKGIWLASELVEACVPDGARFVILGTGYPDLEWRMRDLENRYKGRVCSYIGYNGDLAHRIYAGADFFLMPSAFEPCGISQMIAMRYGTLPIVHETGGLKDTVEPYNQFTREGCGFSFSRFDFVDALGAMQRALSAYGDDDIIRRLRHNAMTRDFGFERCARSYAELYRSMA